MIRELLNLIRIGIRVFLHKPSEMDFVDNSNSFQRYTGCFSHFIGLSIFWIGIIFLLISVFIWVAELIMLLFS